VKEIPVRIIETDYNHQYIEIPTQGWPLAKRWNWIKALLTGGDIIHWPKEIQHIDLKISKHSYDYD
jgi:hypothetical protein